jgi:hypothetical protein
VRWGSTVGVGCDGGVSSAAVAVSGGTHGSTVRNFEAALSVRLTAAWVALELGGAKLVWGEEWTSLQLYRIDLSSRRPLSFVNKCPWGLRSPCLTELNVRQCSWS